MYVKCGKYYLQIIKRIYTPDGGYQYPWEFIFKLVPKWITINKVIIKWEGELEKFTLEQIARESYDTALSEDEYKETIK